MSVTLFALLGQKRKELKTSADTRTAQVTTPKTGEAEKVKLIAPASANRGVAVCRRCGYYPMSFLRYGGMRCGFCGNVLRMEELVKVEARR